MSRFRPLLAPTVHPALAVLHAMHHHLPEVFIKFKPAKRIWSDAHVATSYLGTLGYDTAPAALADLADKLNPGNRLAMARLPSRYRPKDRTGDFSAQLDYRFDAADFCKFHPQQTDSVISKVIDDIGLGGIIDGGACVEGKEVPDSAAA